MNPNQCSFVEEKREVEILVSGNSGYICNNCIEQAHAMIAGSGKNSLSPADYDIDDLKSQERSKNFWMTML